ncbi:hypothetical protein Aargi30884_08500 [Amedibacterium intestinale]|uniref:Uncharacterized protein n=1 Tax=Amedibacterium intestinale TaxID=2583452 RepID=A0A6N4TGU0_9FIRM|nr:hypothetical protein Aargi30884_08500 [Amedibacterium intestinale]
MEIGMNINDLLWICSIPEYSAHSAFSPQFLIIVLRTLQPYKIRGLNPFCCLLVALPKQSKHTGFTFAVKNNT